jgi:hypothetical protein
MIKTQTFFCTLCFENDNQHNEEVLAFSDVYGYTEVGGTPLVFDNELGNNIMSISAGESTNGISDISYVSEYWHENGDYLTVPYDQSPDAIVTPIISREKKKRSQKVEKDIQVLTRELLMNL